MTNLLENIDKRTNLVGENRLELLLFHLSGRQLFALNVFKVKEVVKLPRFNKLPNSHPHIDGVVAIRGESIPVINLKAAIGLQPLVPDSESNLIITEYNRTIQGFLVGKVEHIVNMTWGEIMEPPSTVGRYHYLTAITKLKEETRSDLTGLIEIIDVEKVLAEILNYKVDISEGIVDPDILPEFVGQRILHVDDSYTARKQVANTLEQLGVEIIPAKNGLEALNLLKGWLDQGKCIEDEILMVITDAEMPMMDGYKLTSEIRNDPRMSDMFVVLNTSLSGDFNKAMVEKVGCNEFLSKFQPDRLVEVVQSRLKAKIES
ncbi:chemotaxis protein CheV [Psychromonas sp. 14N.309.X.WAT.B.A12]|uniref:chemotaxis protein CheV n=1 Tax=unclassified Psychromonas TaxID=2614957 RepID=UPI0025B05AD0|nr:chemotaxis protein CheV [Psychromonas sp. 14N.309.X.WAT.B.A12]MDN2663923.1 chemotaxis protein CheV [Psychromonas sp. 14N.309.X.WAT.B.A12]